MRRRGWLGWGGVAAWMTAAVVAAGFAGPIAAQPISGTPKTAGVDGSAKGGTSASIKGGAGSAGTAARSGAAAGKQPGSESKGGAEFGPILAPSTVVAKVNGAAIPLAEVDATLKGILKGRQVDRAAIPELRASVLNQLIDQKLLMQRLEKDKAVVTDAEIEGAIDSIRSALKQQNTTLEQTVAKSGQSLASLRARLAQEMSIERFISKNSTEEAMAEYFQAHQRKFDGTQLQVSHILLRPVRDGDNAEVAELVKAAQRIKADIEGGQMSFAEAAAKYSAGPSRSKGGDLGLIGRDGPMVEAFNRAAFDLEEGKISEPVLTQFGVHLLTVTGTRPGEKKLKDVRDRVGPAFAQELLRKFVDEERAAAKIEYHEAFPHIKRQAPAGPGAAEGGTSAVRGAEGTPTAAARSPANP